MLLKQNEGELISLLTYLGVIYALCTAAVYVNGQELTTLPPNGDLSTEHIEKLCIEKCPDQVSAFTF